MTRTALRLLLCAVLGAVLLVVAPSTADATDAPVTVRGVITDEGGEPLAGIKVDVWDGDAGYDLGHAVTDASGHYRLSYQVTDSVEELSAYGPGFFSEHRIIAGLPGRTYTVDLALRRSQPVVWQTVSGDVVNGAGAPVSSGVVTLLSTVPGGDCAGGPYDTGDGWECYDGGRTATISEGHFETRVNSHYLFSLVVRAAGYETAIVHGVQPDDVVRVVLTAGDGAVAPVTVTGVVTDSAGEPVAGVDVAAVDPDTDLEDTYGGDPEIARTTTDGDGVYTLAFDPLGIDNIERPLVVQVETPDGPVRWHAGDISVGQYYEPGMAITTDIPLGPPSTITGEVRDSEGILLPGVQVCCGIGSATAETDDAGRYSLDVVPGYHTISADATECAPYCWRLTATDVVAQPGATATADIWFRPRPPDPPAPPLPPDPDVTRPAPPQNVTIAAVHPYRVRIRFTPAYSGGRRIREFQASCAGWRTFAPERRARAEGSPIVVTGLRQDYRYTCRVRAKNALGWGRWGNSRWFSTPPD